MRLKTAPRGGEQGVVGGGSRPERRFSWFLCWAGTRVPLNAVTTQPPLLGHRIGLPPHVIGNLTPTQPSARAGS